MLIVLSELNNLSSLQGRKIYPDKFYTDFEQFKTDMPFFQDAHVVIIFLGGYHFRKRLLLEQIGIIKERVNSPDDNGIKELVVISDCNLPTLDKYYKFEFDFDIMYEYGRHDKRSDQIDMISYLRKLSPQKKIADVFLSDYDKGNSEVYKKEYSKRGNTEDEYIKLIIKPDMDAYLKSRDKFTLAKSNSQS